MGGSHLQLWLCVLGNSGQPLDPETANWETDRHYNLHLERSARSSRRGEELWRYPRPSIPAGYVRGGYLA